MQALRANPEVALWSAKRRREYSLSSATTPAAGYVRLWATGASRHRRWIAGQRSGDIFWSAAERTRSPGPGGKP